MGKPVTSERRRFARHRVGVPGAVLMADGRSLPCEVMDISLSGARVTSAVDLPDTFNLRIRPSAAGLVCQVLWRRGAVVGVSFTSRANPDEHAPGGQNHT